MSSSLREPFTLSELSSAYRTAAEREAQRISQGASTTGYKVGFTNTRNWAQMGATEPMWGAMYDDTVTHLAGGTGHYSLAGLMGPRIEPEIVLHFHKAPAPDASLEQILECVDWLAQGYEIVLTPADGVPPTVPQAIANGGMHGALVIAERRAVEDLGPGLTNRLAEVKLELRCDGETKDSGSGANVLGNPLNSVVHLMRGLQREGWPPVGPGSLVTTGTLTAAFPIAPGQRWTTELSSLPLPNLDVMFE